MNIIIETMCDSLRDCIISEKLGAHRIELNSGTKLGGLTPSVGLLKLAKSKIKIPIVTMVRCRLGGFVYTEMEYQTMLEDARIMLENGADGIVFGFLNEDGTIHIERTKSFVTLAHAYQKEAIFHRAFDRTHDPNKAIETLIELKVDRVLTSGLKETVTEGLDTLISLIHHYQDKIEILPGAGIDHENIRHIIQTLKVDQVHGSFKEATYPLGSTFSKDDAPELYYQIGEDNLKKALQEIEGL